MAGSLLVGDDQDDDGEMATMPSTAITENAAMMCDP